MDETWVHPHFGVFAPVCSRCGHPAEGFAKIGARRYCHEGPSPTCYELESWDAPLDR